MIKKIMSLLLLLICFCLHMNLKVQAETLYGNDGWSVVFTQKKEMESNFETKNLDDVIYNMQPGDNAVITIKLENKNDATTDWFMSNKVLSSLEDSVAAASGGAYGYELYYVDSQGEREPLFSSDKVGGEYDKDYWIQMADQREGLHEATAALEDYFYLDTLKKNQTGRIELDVTLDGETQNNAYQSTLADLQMNFAVELNGTTSINTPGSSTNQVNTGFILNEMPTMLLALASGLLFILIALYGYKERKSLRKGG